MGNSSITGAASAFSQMGRQPQLLESLTRSPLFDALKGQERQARIFEHFSKSSALEAFIGRSQTRDRILTMAYGSPALEAFAGRRGALSDQILKSARSSPALEMLTGQSHQWRGRIFEALDKSSVLDSFTAQHRTRHQELLASIGKSSAMEQAFRSWKTSFPPGLADQMAVFQAGLLADWASTAPDEVSEEEKVWFGAESWSRLHFEMVAILKCAELMTAGMVAAKEGLGAPIPSAVMYLLYMFIAAGELAAHFAKDALVDADE
jgi:hypothetical protein